MNSTLPRPGCIHQCSGWGAHVEWQQIHPYDSTWGPIHQHALIYITKCDHTGRWMPLHHMDPDRKTEALDLYHQPALV